MGHQKSNGQWVRSEDVFLTPSAGTTFTSGQSLGSAIDPGACCARLACDVLAIAGTNPTFACEVMTSHDGTTGWRSVGSFAQKTGTARAMSTVSDDGTSPPTLTITGKPNRDINLKVECTTAGALETSEVRISIDGGATWNDPVATAASAVVVTDPSDGQATGLTLGWAAGDAALDNVWTATSGYQMGAVSEAGTTPPDITISGVANRYVDLRVECTTLGSRGVAVIRYSIDGGKTWKSGVTTAATIAIVDPANGDAATGLTLAYENATAAVDNVWTAKMAGFERQVFSGLDRFVRVVANVGGTSTPTATVSIFGEAL